MMFVVQKLDYDLKRTLTNATSYEAINMGIDICINTKEKKGGAEEGTRTLTPKAPEPKSGASTNSATSAQCFNRKRI